MQENKVNQSTVDAYSKKSALAYEDPMNKNFLYGLITTRFLDQIEFAPSVNTVLDVGCGTGFAFDHLFKKFRTSEMTGVGVEPADGMRLIAEGKYKDDPGFEILSGSFESIPLADKSVDKIVSTLALHWVKSLEIAATEMHRVLKDDGSVDILMIARDDGAAFKKAIVNTQRKHLTFRQIMDTATLVQRARVEDVSKAFAPFSGGGFDVQVQEHREVIFGEFEDHMKWWTARSTPVIAEVEDRAQFMADFEVELEKLRLPQGIPFDAAIFWITANRV